MEAKPGDKIPFPGRIAVRDSILVFIVRKFIGEKRLKIKKGQSKSSLIASLESISFTQRETGKHVTFRQFFRSR